MNLKTLILFLFASCSAYCQYGTLQGYAPLDNRIEVMCSELAENEADIAEITLTISAEEPATSEQLPTKHKALEAKLTSFLGDFKLPEEDIMYGQIVYEKGNSGVSYMPSGQMPGQVPTIKSKQTIRVIIRNIKQFPSFISNIRLSDFAMVRIGFKTSKLDQTNEALTKKCLASAQAKATKMAEQIKREILRIESIVEMKDPMFDNIQSRSALALLSDLTSPLQGVVETAQKLKVVFSLK